MWKPAVDEVLSGEPQSNSLKYGSNPKDPASRAGIANRIRQKQEAARRLVNEANKAPSTPLPVPSTPVPINEVPKSVSGTTTLSSNQPGPSAKHSHYTISSTSSTGADPISGLAGGVGDDSFELPLTQLEEHCTHHLMQSMAVIHLLSLRAAFWEEEAESGAKIKKVQADLKQAEAALALATSQMKEISAKHKEEMALKDLELAVLTKENDELKSSQKRQFEIGKRKGREDFLQSEEFQTMLKKARHDGVCDFKKSPEYIVLSQAVNHVMAAFNMCQTQLQKLGDLNDGCDLIQLDVIKTENLEDYPDPPLPDFGIDEFRKA